MYRSGGFGMSLFPPAIKGILIANVAVFLLQNFFSMFHIGEYTLSQYIFAYGALFPLGEGSNFNVWQLITYQFMHGDFFHIFFNLWMLWMFGVELEELWGTKKFITFYLLCGIGAGLAQLFISPLLTTVGPTVGASGAIYGIFLAFALTFPDRTLMVFPIFIPIKAKYLILLMAGFEMIFGFSSSGSVAHFAHLGGALSAYILLLIDRHTTLGNSINNFFSKKKPGFSAFNPSTSRSSSTAEVHKMNWTSTASAESAYKTRNAASSLNVDGEQITQVKVDEILDKISASGYQNLTDKEKKILFELSQKLK
jgi:membrane associated rhomboid family serine protease